MNTPINNAEFGNNPADPIAKIKVRGVVASTLGHYADYSKEYHMKSAAELLHGHATTAGQFGEGKMRLTRRQWNDTIKIVRKTIATNPADSYNQKLERYCVEVETELAQIQ